MRRRLCDLDPLLAPPWHEQFSPDEERRQAAAERAQEDFLDSDDGEFLMSVEPEKDPWDGVDFAEALDALGRAALTPWPPEEPS